MQSVIVSFICWLIFHVSGRIPLKGPGIKGVHRLRQENERVNEVLEGKIMNSSGTGDGNDYPASVQPLRIRAAGALPQTDDRQRPSAQPLVIIDKRELRRECLAQIITADKLQRRVLAYGSAEEWEEHRSDYPPPAQSC